MQWDGTRLYQVCLGVGGGRKADGDDQGLSNCLVRLDVHWGQVQRWQLPVTC